MKILLRFDIKSWYGLVDFVSMVRLWFILKIVKNLNRPYPKTYQAIPAPTPRPYILKTGHRGHIRGCLKDRI